MGSSTETIVPMSYFPKVQTEFKPPLIANENAFLGDVASSEKNSPDAPISCGIYRLEKGTPLVYKYTYHEMKIILDGHFDITDETGKTVHATKGDVFYFPAGCTITFTTSDFGLAFVTPDKLKVQISDLLLRFYTGQRKEGGA